MKAILVTNTLNKKKQEFLETHILPCTSIQWLEGWIEFLERVEAGQDDWARDNILDRGKYIPMFLNMCISFDKPRCARKILDSLDVPEDLTIKQGLAYIDLTNNTKGIENHD